MNEETKGPSLAAQAWTHIDKSSWPRGEWNTEPDKVQWVDAASGLDCLALRNPWAGHWCGYVGVPEAHRFHGKGVGECAAVESCGERYCGHCAVAFFDVHGGITFAEGCHEPTRDQYDTLDALATDPSRVAEAAEYPQGDAARRIASFRAQSALSFEDWQADQQTKRICHIPQPGRSGDVWWLGFNCAHGGDIGPGRDEIVFRDGWYKPLGYVEGECQSLARQLAAVRT